MCIRDRCTVSTLTIAFVGIPYQQRRVQLKCVVQCFPLCDIVWHRNSTPIQVLTKQTLSNGVIQGNGSLDSFTKFVIRTELKPPKQSDNVLEHVESTMTLVSPRFEFSKCSNLNFRDLKVHNFES